MEEPPPPRPTAEAPSLAKASRWVVILLGSFFLLRELAPILKPLCLAILLAYVILPFHFMVKKRVPRRLSLIASTVLSISVLLLLTLGIQVSVRTVMSELPELSAKAKEMFDDLRKFSEKQFPAMTGSVSQIVLGDGDSVFREMMSWLVAVATNTLTTAAVVGLYLLFILVEASRFPDRVRRAFSEHRSETILTTINGINQAIAYYLNAKLKASLILAVPIFVILFVFGAPFAIIWAVLVFLCNFIPYLGSVVGYGVPTLFVLVQFSYGWEFVTIAILMLSVHIATATLVEPWVIGKAVGLSPLLVLLSLAFWGFLWGLTGMLLAVPLTLMMKIVAEHIESTRPVAKMLGEN